MATESREGSLEAPVRHPISWRDEDFYDGDKLDAELRRVFDPFYTTKVKGSGLGLFVVQRLIEEMKGSIRIQSEIGRGTRFVILLPWKEDGESSGN